MSSETTIYLISEELGQVFTLSLRETGNSKNFYLDHVQFKIPDKKELKVDDDYLKIICLEKRTPAEAAIIYGLRMCESYPSIFNQIRGITLHLLEELFLKLIEQPQQFADQTSINLIICQPEDPKDEYLEMVGLNGRYFFVTDNWHYYFNCLID